jgi:RND family efflux transporter MFP subunit
MKIHYRLYPVALMLLTLLWTTGCGEARNGAQAEPAAAPAPAVMVVKAGSPQRGEWVVSVPISGDLRSQSRVEVRAEVGGRLIATHFKEGDLVSKDQLLAEIDSVNYRLALDQASAAVGVAEAGLARARISADHARREKERADNLLRSGGITEKDHQAAATGVNEAESQVNFAAAQVNQAKAAVAIAEKSLHDCRILAPADGHVQKRYFDTGSLLAAGSPLYMLVDNNRLELECLLPSYRFAEIRLGQPAVFTTPTWEDQRFNGVVVSTNPAVDSDNRSIRVTIRINNPRSALRTGMFARGEIEIKRQSNALMIPRSALIAEKEESGSGSVFLVIDGKSARKAVEVGGIQQDKVWVKSGLADSDSVILEIGPAVKDGIKVRAAASGTKQGD